MAPIPVITKVFAFKLVPPSSVICVLSIRQKRMPRPLLQAQKSRHGAGFRPKAEGLCLHKKAPRLFYQKNRKMERSNRETLCGKCAKIGFTFCANSGFFRRLTRQSAGCRPPPGTPVRPVGTLADTGGMPQYPNIFSIAKIPTYGNIPRIFLLIYIGNHPGRRALSAEMLPRQLSLCRKIAYTRNTPGRVSCFVACVQTARRMFQINVPCLEGGPTDA